MLLGKCPHFVADAQYWWCSGVSSHHYCVWIVWATMFMNIKLYSKTCGFHKVVWQQIPGDVLGFNPPSSAFDYWLQKQWWQNLGLWPRFSKVPILVPLLAYESTKMYHFMMKIIQNSCPDLNFPAFSPRPVVTLNNASDYRAIGPMD